MPLKCSKTISGAVHNIVAGSMPISTKFYSPPGGY